MTLIAALDIQGHKFIISDIVIMSELEPEQDPLLPSSTIHEQFPVDGKDYVVDTLQKTVVFNGNFALAWAGNENEARCVLDNLRKLAESNELTHELVTNFFDEYDMDPSSPGGAAFVGWLYENGEAIAVSFLAKKKTFEHFGDIWCAGTGIPALESLARHHENLHARESVRSSNEKSWVTGNKAENPQYLAMTLIADLMSRESLDQLTLRHKFGGCYQLHFLKDGIFEAVSSYAFFMFEIEFDKNGAFHKPVLSTKVDYINELLLVHAKGFNADKKPRSFRSVIPSPLKRKEEYPQSEIDKFKNSEIAINSDWLISCAIAKRIHNEESHPFIDLRFTVDHPDHCVYFSSFHDFKYKLSGEYLSELNCSF